MNFLKNARINQGIKQSELAEKVGTTRQTIATWEEEGGFPPAKMLPSLSEILNVSIDYLITGKDFEKKSNHVSYANSNKNTEIVLSDTVQDKTIAGKNNNQYVLLNNNSMIVAGRSGTGKSYNYLLPYIIQAGKRGERIIVADALGALEKSTKVELTKLGYDVITVNTEELGSSINLFSLVTMETIDLFIKSLYESISNSNKNDVYWINLEKILLKYTVLDMLYNDKTPSVNSIMDELRSIEFEEWYNRMLNNKNEYIAGLFNSENNIKDLLLNKDKGMFHFLKGSLFNTMLSIWKRNQCSVSKSIPELTFKGLTSKNNKVAIFITSEFSNYSSNITKILINWIINILVSEDNKTKTSLVIDEANNILGCIGYEWLKINDVIMEGHSVVLALQTLANIELSIMKSFNNIVVLGQIFVDDAIKLERLTGNLKEITFNNDSANVFINDASQGNAKAISVKKVSYDEIRNTI